MKDALSKSFDINKRGFRRKFRYDRPEKLDTFIQFSSRLRSYFKKMVEYSRNKGILVRFSWLVGLGLTALRDNISVYIGPSPKEREKEAKG